ncbi:MAG: SRPBCC family protein [Pseudomonas sp.]|uniref:SRPBCC family protein n=1 Tax=Pseudomonas sp. TaxID=306 RepID=UPI002488E83C|nr:SRPBCC family protein [Pseudomonas sp.]MDI1333167.1 SRPBCC family protein [Pseudomonas sp.]MDO9329261.1 SRPBCC family protein [Pseudomonas sp.]
MAKASAFIDIPASADEVWQLIGGFDTLPDWLPFIPKSELSEGGRVRSLQTADGAEVVERLETFDNAGKTYSYSILHAPFPATEYLATIKVEAQGQGARVTWSGRFTPVGVSETEVEALFAGIYQGGLEALRANYPA